VQVDACVFDAYGTLLDLRGATARLDHQLGDSAARVLALWRAKQLEYCWLRTVMHRHADFDTVTRQALEHVLEVLGLREPTRERMLLDAFRLLDPYPDAAPLLVALRARGLRLAVLSNGVPTTLATAFQHAGLAPLLDVVLSVEAVGRFKPAPEVYRLAMAALDLPPARIMFVSAHGWDVAGAANAGFRGVLVNRADAPLERLPTGAERVVGSLADVASLVTT